MNGLKCIFCMIMFLITIACDEPDVRVPNQVDSLLMHYPADQTGWDVEIRFIDTSFTKAKLRAKRTRIFQDRMETILDGGLLVDFYSKSSKGRVSRLTADSAVVDDRTKNMVAYGNVFIIADSSLTTLKTSVLHWNNSTEKIYTTEFVRIESPNEILQGFGFESDLNLTNYRIFKVSGEQK